MMKKMMIVVALVALGGVAGGQEMQGGQAAAKPAAVEGFAEKTYQDRLAEASDKTADAVVSVILERPTADLDHDEKVFVRMWANSVRDTDPTSARAAYAHIGLSAFAVASLVGDKAEFESEFAADLARGRVNNMGELVDTWTRLNDADADQYMVQLNGRGVTDPVYQTWLRGHLATLSTGEAISLLETELRALLARSPETPGRTEAIRELRAQMIILRDLAGE